MPRPHNEKQRKNKIGKIVDGAHRVFCRKGFLAVTMQDIIDECNISRGGIYIYFSSVDEVFLEVMKQRNKERLSAISKSVQDKKPFEEVLEIYLARQKQRLMNFENSIFRAYCEYIFSKPKAAVEALRDMQLGHLRQSITSVLELGISQRAIFDVDVDSIAYHFIVVIDGLSVLALAEALTEEIVDAQIAIIKKTVDSLREDAKNA